MGIDNDSDYIEVYNKDDELVSPDSYDETLITTGSKLKLVINGITHDEVIVIIRGDINEDGRVNITDSTSVVSHILLKEMIEGYKVYAADIVETEGAPLDEAINVVDNTRIEEYILLKRDSLNEKDGD